MITIKTPSVLLTVEEYHELKLLKERVDMKLVQLKGTEFEEFGGLGTGDDIGNRATYITLLEWLLSLRRYANPSSEFVGIRTHEEGRPLC